MLKDNLWNKLFHNSALKEQKKQQKKEQHLDNGVSKFIYDLYLCNDFDDLMNLHRKIVDYGFSFNTEKSWNFSYKDIHDINVNALVFEAYDRDTCIHGSDLLELEENPEKYSDNDWFNWSYWVAYRWYWLTLYKKIKNHRNPTQPLSELPNIPIPDAVKSYF